MRMARLLLGPILRHVGQHDASVWVETDARCSVEIRAGDVTGTERTFSVGGHHYAVVVVTGLASGSSTPYEVALDGDRAWPLDGSTHPASRIRTIDPARPIRIISGSCREPPVEGDPVRPGLDPDVLEAYAIRMASLAHEEWPDAFLMIGDQVYADDTSPKMRDFIRTRRDPGRDPKFEVADFEEYTRLYYESWGTPNIRWLLSTLPSSMMFDDHDVKDDWNTSESWRRDMQATDWWEERITGALMSYWIYQHLGNLSPAGLAANETYQAVRAVPDAEAVLRAFAQHADREADGAKGTMWSYRRDLGNVRLVVIDSRCGRILAEGERSMISTEEFGWIEAQMTDGSYDHLVVGTSLPWLLPRALHDIESWDEGLATGEHGRLAARFGEWLRRAVDLEHWAAFRKSFDLLAGLFARIGRGDDGLQAPATICVVSGDVHHTYLAEADYPFAVASRVYQVTCSPMHNTIPRLMRYVFRFGWSRRVERLLRHLDRFAGVPPMPIRWHHPTGPHFGNALALLVFDGRSARLVLERSIKARHQLPGEDEDVSTAGLEIVVELALTEDPRI
jgi:hypothetical protein